MSVYDGRETLVILAMAEVSHRDLNWDVESDLGWVPENRNLGRDTVGRERKGL